MVNLDLVAMLNNTKDNISAAADATNSDIVGKVLAGLMLASIVGFVAFHLYQNYKFNKIEREWVQEHGLAQECYNGENNYLK